MTMSASTAKFRTSQQAEDTLRMLQKKTSLPFNLLCRIAWSRSLQAKHTLDLSSPDITGKEFNRYSVTGEFDDVMKALTAEAAGRKLSEEEFVGEYLKAHVDRGLGLLATDIGESDSVDLFWSRLLEKLPIIPQERSVTKTASIKPINLLVGEEMSTDQPVVCSINQATNPHMAIIGIPGSGKTQFIKKLLADIRTQYEGINFIFLDYAKGDVAGDDKFVEKTKARVLRLPDKPLPLNPFALPSYDQAAVSFAAEEKVESLHSYQALGAVQKGLLSRAIEAAYQARTAEDLPFPDFETVYQELQRVYEQEDKSDDTLTEVLRKLTAFHLFPTLGECSHVVENLAEETLIIDLHALPALRELVAFCLIEKLYRELKAMPDAPVDSQTNSRQLRTLLIIDEAHNYLPRNNIFLEKLIREMRSKGLAVVLLSQSPDDFEQKRFDYTELLEFVFVLKCTTNKPQHIQKLIRCRLETAKNLVPKLSNLPYPQCYTQNRTDLGSDYTHMKAAQFHLAYR
jgi:DNA sulfur modification protein DndE